MGLSHGARVFNDIGRFGIYAYTRELGRVFCEALGKRDEEEKTPRSGRYSGGTFDAENGSVQDIVVGI